MSRQKNNAKRDDGLFQKQVYLGRDEKSGKRICKVVYGRTQKEANDKADEVKLALKKGIDVSPELVTFSQWADRWIKIKKSEISAVRAVVYEANIKHLKAAFGGMDITKIRPANLQDVLIDLSINNPNTGKPMVKKTLSGLKSTALQIFQLAVDNRVMDFNPARSVKIPARDTPAKTRALTDAEQKWITDTPHRAQLAAMIMMYSGLRRGELITLTWNDINLSAGTITVNKAVEIVRGKPVLKDFAKTPSSIRAVNIPNRLVNYLKAQKRQSIYVCVSTQNKMHTQSSWRRMWESYLSDLNIRYGDFSPFEKVPTSKFDPAGAPFVIPNINPHWLRHTFCTMLYFAGVDILTAKNQMGHADIKTTLEIYTHLDALHKAKEISKLNTYLDGPQENEKGDSSNIQVKGS